jgi:predicted DCC family thiol-disulfide oxidoreductase YuxK
MRASDLEPFGVRQAAQVRLDIVNADWAGHAIAELHVRDENQHIYSEIDAYILLMARVPKLKPLAWLIDLPVIRPLLSSIYRWMVNRRLKKSGRL